MRRLAHLGTLFACCVWGAVTGWAAALAVAPPQEPGITLLVYGASAFFGGGYLLGSAIRGCALRGLGVRAAVLAAAAALGAKLLAPALAGWVAFLLATAVFGILCGLVRRPG